MYLCFWVLCICLFPIIVYLCFCVYICIFPIIDQECQGGQDLPSSWGCPRSKGEVWSSKKRQLWLKFSLLSSGEFFWLNVPCFIPDLQLSSLATEYELNRGIRDEQGGVSDQKTLVSSGLEVGTPTMPLSNKPRGRGRPPMATGQDLGVKLTMKEGKGESMFLAKPQARGQPQKVKGVVSLTRHK